MKGLSCLKDKGRFLIAFVVRCFWRILGREYFICVDESYYQDYYCEIEGYKTKDGHIHITKECYRGLNNVI